MGKRTAAIALLLVSAAQLLNLWPLPHVEARGHLAFYTRMKAEWEATDPAKLENPSFTAQTKSESLSRINEVLADPDDVLYGAIFRWALWLLCAALIAAAGVMALRRSSLWTWLALASVLLFMLLQQPWHAFQWFFRFQGFSHIEFLANREPSALALMLVFNIVVPTILLAVAAYGLVDFKRGRRGAP